MAVSGSTRAWERGSQSDVNLALQSVDGGLLTQSELQRNSPEMISNTTVNVTNIDWDFILGDVIVVVHYLFDLLILLFQREYCYLAWLYRGLLVK